MSTKKHSLSFENELEALMMAIWRGSLKENLIVFSFGERKNVFLVFETDEPSSSLGGSWASRVAP